MGLRSYPRFFFELIFIGFSIMIGMSLSGSFLPLLAADLDPSGLLVGLVVSAWFISRIFIELPAGMISDRLGRRRLFLTGVGLSVFGAALCAVANTIYLLIVGRSIWGLGAGLFFMNNTALIIDLFESKTRAKALGLFNGIEQVGSIIGAPIGAALVGTVGDYSHVLYVTMALVSVSFVLGLVSKSFKQTQQQYRTSSSLSMRETLQNIRSSGLLVVCTCTFTNMIVMTGIFSTVLQLHFSRELLFPLEDTGIVLSSLGLGSMSAALCSGFFSDRFGKRFTVTLGYGLSAICLGIFAFATNLEIFLLVGLIGYFGEGLAGNTLMVILSELVHPSARGGAIGLQRTFMDAGGFLGPIISMLIYSTLGSQAAFLSGVAIKALNISLFILMKNLGSEKRAR
jgi:MFS family permease